jgi:hypothetical protein
VACTDLDFMIILPQLPECLAVFLFEVNNSAAETFGKQVWQIPRMLCDCILSFQ